MADRIVGEFGRTKGHDEPVRWNSDVFDELIHHLLLRLLSSHVRFVTEPLVFLGAVESDQRSGMREQVAEIVQVIRSEGWWVTYQIYSAVLSPSFFSNLTDKPIFNPQRNPNRNPRWTNSPTFR